MKTEWTKREKKDTEILKLLNVDIFLLVLESNWTLILNLKNFQQDILKCHIHKNTGLADNKNASRNCFYLLESLNKIEMVTVMCSNPKYSGRALIYKTQGYYNSHIKMWPQLNLGHTSMITLQSVFEVDVHQPAIYKSSMMEILKPTAKYLMGPWHANKTVPSWQEMDRAPLRLSWDTWY